jgi:hypothetical protein
MECRGLQDDHPTRRCGTVSEQAFTQARPLLPWGFWAALILRLVDWTPSDRRWRREAVPATIRLRVIDYPSKGFRPGAIVTSVLEADEVSREEWTGLARVDDTGGCCAARGCTIAGGRSSWTCGRSIRI